MPSVALLFDKMYLDLSFYWKTLKILYQLIFVGSYMLKCINVISSTSKWGFFFIFFFHDLRPAVCKHVMCRWRGRLGKMIRGLWRVWVRIRRSFLQSDIQTLCPNVALWKLTQTEGCVGNFLAWTPLNTPTQPAGSF